MRYTTLITKCEAEGGTRIMYYLVGMKTSHSAEEMCEQDNFTVQLR